MPTISHLFQNSELISKAQRVCVAQIQPYYVLVWSWSPDDAGVLLSGLDFSPHRAWIDLDHEPPCEKLGTDEVV